MSPFTFDPIPLDELDARTDYADTDWLWHGYLARGNITLFTSRWKSGKTTLLAGMLRAFGGGGELLGRACQPAAALVASEESIPHWRDRQKAIPVGPHTHLVSRPFPGRPSAAEWEDFVRRAEDLRTARQLDLFVVDTLATFLPGKSDSDPATLLTMLHPLRRLTAKGAAVLILHHPRKAASKAGSSARGSGALLGFVDVILELGTLGHLPRDANRRRLVGLSRHDATPRSLVYEWTPGTADFAVVADTHGVRYRENWEDLRTVLAGLKGAATHHEVLAAWPAGKAAPNAKQLYDWLSMATAEGLLVRTGRGTRGQPYRYRPPGEVDAFTLPPLDV